MPPPDRLSNSETAARLAYDHLRDEATERAGTNADTARRARLYRELYEHSLGSHTFPLIAAHGAIWGRGYFAKGRALGHVLASLGAPGLRQARIEGLDAFIEAFRAINRQVFIEVWTSYHFTADHADSAFATTVVGPRMLDGLARCHAARRAGFVLGRAEQRSLFETVFRWEQEEVVGAAVDRAVAAFDWTWMRELSLRPVINFGYIPLSRRFRVRSMASQDERIARGLAAYDIAADVGWPRVMATLDRTLAHSS